MKVRAVQPHPYDGIHRAAGDEYDMKDEYVKVMTDYGNVVPAELQRRDMSSSEPRKYRRRDMKATE